MDIVLGLSMTPAAVRMVLVEGQNADGVTVAERTLPADVATDSAIDLAAAAILDARAEAAAAGNRVTSVGVTCTEPIEAAGLCDALSARGVDHVTIAPPFRAAAAWAREVGQSAGYERTALLYLEAEAATMAGVGSADAAITGIRTESLGTAGGAMKALMDLAAGTEALETPPDGVFVLGSGMNLGWIKQQVAAATSLAVGAAEDPETALARGAALVSVSAPQSSLSTEAFAYARVSAENSCDAQCVSADAETVDEGFADDAGLYESPQRRRPVLLLGSTGAVVLISVVVALEVSLGLGIRPAAVGLHHIPGENRIVAAPLMPLAPLPGTAVPHPISVRPSGPPGNVPGPTGIAPSGGSAPALLALPVLMPNPAVPLKTPDADYPNYPILLPLPVAPPATAAPSLPTRQLPHIPAQPSTTPAVSPTTVPASQTPASQTPTTVPASQTPESPQPTRAPVSQPPASVPVSQPPDPGPVTPPPTYVPVSQPPRPVPVAPPAFRIPEPPAPLHAPAPEVPAVTGVPGLEAPPVLNQPVPQVPATPGSPGLGGLPGQEAPAGVPEMPRPLTPPVSGPSPALGPSPVSEGGGVALGGSGGAPAGGGLPGAGIGSPGAGGGSLGGGSSIGGGGSSGGGSVGGGGSLGGSSSIGGGGSLSTGGGSGSSGGKQ
ncbi:DUF7159 family protein [Mycobacterium sp. ML4]